MNSAIKPVFLLILANSFLFAQAPEFRRTTPEDYKPRFQDRPDFNEGWSYQILLDNGTQVYLDLSRLNDGKNRYTTASLFFVGFKDANYNVACQYPAETYWAYSGNAESFKLTFHKNIFIQGSSQSQKVSFFREKNGVRYYADLDFTEMVPGFALKQGEVKLKTGHTAGIIIHFPKAKVKGQIAINGDTLHVSGEGYSDHIYQSALPTSVLDRGIRFFGPGENMIAGVVLKANKNNSRQVMGLAVKVSGDSLLPLYPTGLSGSLQHASFHDNSTLEFVSFRKQHVWGILDEAPKALSFFASALKKDLKNIRGKAKDSNHNRYILTKLKVE